MTAPSVERFQTAAESLCAFATREEALETEDLWRIRDLLLQLIFHIPAVEAHQQGGARDGARIETVAYERATRRFSDLPLNFYRVVFDPLDLDGTDEPVVGSLVDDLADIYRDLSEGLDNARQGYLDEACFDWALSYRSHWCRHAVSAITAIEIYRTEASWE